MPIPSEPAERSEIQGLVTAPRGPDGIETWREWGFGCCPGGRVPLESGEWCRPTLSRQIECRQWGLYPPGPPGLVGTTHD
jgi:hypothetical protein